MIRDEDFEKEADKLNINNIIMVIKECVERIRNLEDCSINLLSRIKYLENKIK